jgi:mRNA interferase MazF
MVINRGEIWWANLPAPQASEPGFKRPVLIIQSDTFNKSTIKTVIAVVITSNTKLADAPGNILLEKKQSGLPKSSVINISQVITLDKSFLQKRVKVVSRKVLEQVEYGLKLVMAL